MLNRFLLIIPFFILIFVFAAPFALRRLFPGAANTDLFGQRQLGKACFGIVIPKDKYPFIFKKTISFDTNEYRGGNACFGVDVYYGE